MGVTVYRTVPGLVPGLSNVWLMTVGQLDAQSLNPVIPTGGEVISAAVQVYVVPVVEEVKERFTLVLSQIVAVIGLTTGIARQVTFALLDIVSQPDSVCVMITR